MHLFDCRRPIVLGGVVLIVVFGVLAVAMIPDQQEDDGSSSASSTITLSATLTQQRAAGDHRGRARRGLHIDAEAAEVAFMANRLRATKRWLLQEWKSFRAERRILEDLIRLKDEDLEFHRHRLEGAQDHVGRLRRELRECRIELLERRKQHNQALIDSMRLRAENCELRSLIRKKSSVLYQSAQEKNCRVQYMDTEF